MTFSSRYSFNIYVIVLLNGHTGKNIVKGYHCQRREIMFSIWCWLPFEDAKNTSMYSRKKTSFIRCKVSAGVLWHHLLASETLMDPALALTKMCQMHDQRQCQILVNHPTRRFSKHCSVNIHTPPPPKKSQKWKKRESIVSKKIGHACHPDFSSTAAACLH